MSKSKYALKVKGLNKTFVIREKGKRSIKDNILKFYQQKGDLREINALIDINFEVKKGEFFGIIGRNGSGKSTLLRLIMGSFNADAGSVIKSKGRMIRLAMGLGFDMNLSARDNIYVNASVLGISFKKIGTIFHEIIEFAELEKFIDTPVKHYSSGMVAKLKFSIAKYAEADILLMDEIFGGVGDISFQHKSQKVFKDKIIAGKTIILVSHNLSIISEYCTRVLLLDRGKQIAVGPPEEIIPMYEELFEDVLKEKKEAREKIRLERYELRRIEREKLFEAKKKKIEETWLQSKEEKEKLIEAKKKEIEETRLKRQEERENKRKLLRLEQKEEKDRWKNKIKELIKENQRILAKYKEIKLELNRISKENERLKSSVTK